jgi:outer membrane protein OmpA-like peptidoglycan-associated protein
MAKTGWFGVVLMATLLAGCNPSPPPAPPMPVAAAPAPPPAPVPFDQAVLNAGNAVFTAASLPGTRPLVIDPLVNGVTGEQSASTRALGTRLAELARQKYPQYDVQPFRAETVAAAPLVMVGTFTPVNAQNQPAGAREAYRFCLVLADLQTGRTVAKSVARSTLADIDGTPTRAFADSPAWTEDAGEKAYIATCQATKVGDPIPPVYLNGIITAAVLNQAMEAYDGGRYREALELYENARKTPAGDQLRTYNGLYLANLKLGQRQQAEAAFGDLVDFGLRNNRLAMKLLFRPASTAFAEGQSGLSYDSWLRQVADRGARSTTCLQVTGHTSTSGSAVLNDRLSVLRAEYVKGLLEQDNAALRGRTVATGMGGQQPLVGTGRDDASDALDRRVEFKVIPACG